MIARILTLLLALTLGAPALGAGPGAVTLRSSARVAEGEPVRLGDVAMLHGAEAERLAGVVIMDAVAVSREPAGAWLSVDVHTVRDALKARPGINWGRLAVRGSSCAVRATPADAGRADRHEGRGGARASRPDEPVVRDQVSARIVQVLGARASDVRITLDERDADLLNTPTTGRVIEVQPLGSSDRMPLAVSVYENDRIVASGTVRAHVLVRRTVAVLQNAVGRGERITEDELLLDAQWLGPNDRSAVPEEAVGAVLRRRMSAGDVLRVHDIEPPIIVRRGDIVEVRSVTDSIVLRTKARATSAARDGEVLEFRALGSDRAFRARMNGRGRAVNVADGATTAPAGHGRTVE